VSLNYLSGMGVSPGIAIGEPVVHETLPISTVRISIPASETDAEVDRFKKAVRIAVDRIRESQKRAAQQMGEEYAAIFEAHQLIASDPSFLEPVEKIIVEQQVNAEWAVDQIVACLGISRSGIDFDAEDGTKTHIFFTLLAPEDSPGEHLKVLAKISRLCQDPAFRQRLLEATTSKQILQTIKDSES